MRRWQTIMAISLAAVVLCAAAVRSQRQNFFAPVRELNPREHLTRDDLYLWHEFQFSEPCDVVATKLGPWKDGLYSSGQRFVMTDMDDPDSTPSIWARSENFVIRPPIEFEQHERCGFAVGLLRSHSLLERLWLKVRNWF